MSLETDWESDFARRVAEVPSGHTIRGLFLQSYLEKLRALGDEALLARGLLLCGNAPPVELFLYPVQVQLQLLTLLMPSLISQYGDAASALRVVGRQNVSRFLSTAPGRLLMKLSGRDPRRLLTHAPMGYRIVASMGEHFQTWSTPRQCHWHMRRQMMPMPFHEGRLRELLEQGQARDAQVVGRQTSLFECEFDITWAA